MYTINLILILIGTAHCAVMYPPSKKDSPELKAAKSQVEDLIGQWLQNKM